VELDEVRVEFGDVVRVEVALGTLINRLVHFFCFIYRVLLPCYFVYY
jgi:hypothetical protein